MLALNDGLRHVGLPVQNLLQEFLCELIQLVDLVDNQQAVTAVERGYSKKIEMLEPQALHCVWLAPCKCW